MNTKVEQFPTNNPNPVLSVGKDGTVLYSNEAGEPLLHEWGVEIGGKLPSTFGDLVQRVISLNRPEKTEVKTEKKVYLVTFHPSTEEKHVNIYGFDITDQKKLEERVRIKEKQNDILYKIGKAALEYENLQNFLDESVKLIASILELEYCKILELIPDGNFLLRAGFGWKHGLVGRAIVEGEKESQAGYTLLSRTPVVVEDFEEESRFKKPELLRMHEVNSGVSVAIGSTGKTFGVLGVHSRKKRKFTSDDTYFLSSVAFLIAQVIERKKAEEALKEAYDSLDEKVHERTEELEIAYNSLKESEKSLAEAQEMAHIGNWERDFESNEFHWSDEVYRIFGLKPQEFEVNYGLFLSYLHPDDQDYVNNAVKEALNGKPFDIDFRIILANGEERIAHAKGEVVFDEKNNPVRIRGITQDITEHKKAEEKIQTLANAVESSTDAIITKSLDGVITSWNKGAEQVYGYSAGEVLGKPMSVLEPSTLTGETEKLSEMIKRGEKIHNYETSRLRKDDTIINVSITLSPIFDLSGKLIAISAIARDITERKIAEEKLRESEEKYRNIVETSNEGIYLVDNEAKIIYVNKIMETSGYTLDELIGRPIWDFISEESRPVARKSFEKRRQGIDDSYELKLVRKDGSFIWGLVSAKSLFNKEGRFMGFLGMLTDITERKKAEEALASLETARKKEIHHRIKNNLQVISSLLDLQAEQFRNRENIKDSEVLEALRESQDRVTSMALIHEELYRGGGFETLNFSPYIQELAENLLLTYSLGDTEITLSTDLEEDLFFDIDTAVPLGMIVNELVSNSLKHAFPDRRKGKIRIKLSREENEECMKNITGECKSTSFTLTVSDDGVGIPENLDIEELDSLGFQLVTSLADQLDGEFELKKDNGTEFTMRFTVTEKDKLDQADLRSQEN
ncbi:sensory transduction histidine kinase [Methanosarcina siciliae HI350]|uniref:Sensory transduction histidine kinase n=1 Tax=Methanosarcina siciliae HI350 TaxID=1434119 RepID=A0A0E3LAE5_9EURY|nr:PAS domain S-box protein [Methanosarcina siciliae]AKB31881.1 sensory transduction histidine kinase [Methanosarcina siciliae HI350]